MIATFRRSVVFARWRPYAPPSNMSTRVCSPNSISIGSVVFAWFTLLLFYPTSQISYHLQRLSSWPDTPSEVTLPVGIQTPSNIPSLDPLESTRQGRQIRSRSFRAIFAGLMVVITWSTYRVTDTQTTLTQKQTTAIVVLSSMDLVCGMVFMINNWHHSDYVQKQTENAII